MLSKNTQTSSTTLQVFLLVSNESDFALAAHRLQSCGTVIGLGSPIAAPLFQEACTIFVVLPTATDTASLARMFHQDGHSVSIKQTQPEVTVLPMNLQKKATEHVSAPPKLLDDPVLTQAIEATFEAITDQQKKETVLLVDVAKALKERVPSLRAKDYGEKTLLFLVKARTDLFVFQQIERDGKTLDEMRRREQ